jgi:hypothetical protein
MWLLKQGPGICPLARGEGGGGYFVASMGGRPVGER